MCNKSIICGVLLGIGKERPAFTATLTGRPIISGMKAILKFDNVILNREGGYDPKTGIFTAPRTGLYQISVTIMSDYGKQLALFIAKNDLALLNLFGAALHGSNYESHELTYTVYKIIIIVIITYFIEKTPNLHV
jgi:hypothetical protein